MAPAASLRPGPHGPQSLLARIVRDGERRTVDGHVDACVLPAPQQRRFHDGAAYRLDPDGAVFQEPKRPLARCARPAYPGHRTGRSQRQLRTELNQPTRPTHVAQLRTAELRLGPPLRSCHAYTDTPGP